MYRALDTDQFNANGPLREMVNRIGATAASLRRSIDRLMGQPVDRDLRRLGDPIYRRPARYAAG